MSQWVVSFRFKDRAAYEAATEVFYELFPQGFVSDDPRVIQEHIEQNDWDSHEYETEILEQASLGLQVYLDQSQKDAALIEIQTRFQEELEDKGLPLPTYSLEELQDEDWEHAWMESFGVLHYGERIQIVPDWLEPDEEGGDVAIIINPGLAFGTGSHETTGLCLEILADRVEEGMTVFDIGCGSGILAVAVRMLGADRVDAVDTDPIALRSAASLGARNDAAIMVYPSDLMQSVLGQGDIVIANIVPEAIIRIFGQLDPKLAPGGCLIASGIRTDREEEVIEAGREMGFVLIERRERGGWVALVFARKEEADGIL